MRCMRCVARVAVPHARTLVLRPEATVDPQRYPHGYVALTGNEPVDAVYRLVQEGHFVAPLRHIEVVHRAYRGVRSLCRAEHPIVTPQDVVHVYLRERELLSRLLIRRDFWALDDYNDNELNTSFGVQNLYFDNYKWSQVLWRRFQLYVEEYYPAGEHTHLHYSEYTQLIRSFAAFEQGMRAVPLLPRHVRLHPPYGVAALTRSTLAPLTLLVEWVQRFRKPLALHSALVVHAGSGVAAFALRLAHVPMVRGVDARPRAVAACRADTACDPRLATVSFSVAELLPPPPPAQQQSRTDKSATAPSLRRYDLLVYYPDEDMVTAFWHDDGDTLLRTTRSVAGALADFFEHCADHLADTGVIAICCTNMYAMQHPHEPHPIEYEVKVNRRFVILDYYDAPLRAHAGGVSLGSASSLHDVRLPASREVYGKLRAELWVLHKVDALAHFAFMHGVPGATVPASAQRRLARAGMLRRQRALRAHVELMGGDWGEYKTRLAQMLQEQSDGVPEDDVAEALRMAFDASYPAELAARARRASELAQQHADTEQQRIARDYAGDTSPRQAFDAMRFLQ